MKCVAVFALAASCLAGCAEKQLGLACTVQEQGSAARTLGISATLAGPSHEGDGARNLEGTTEFRDGSRIIQVSTHGVYMEHADRREFELLTFGDLPNGMGKLNVAVQPDHPVLRRRGITAVVLTGEQTVENATPAIVNCRTVGPS